MGGALAAALRRVTIRIRVKPYRGLMHAKNLCGEILRPLRGGTTCAAWVWDRLQNGRFCHHLHYRRKPTSGRFSGATTHCRSRRPTTAWRHSNPFSAAASDLFPPPSPYPYANALAAFGALSPPAVGASSLLFGTPAAPTPPWHYVRWRFRAFLANLAITPPQREDGTTKQTGVRACLNRHYYGTPSETANSFLIGSWGKGTQVRPSRDIDILFLLPGTVWQSYQQRVGNKQSQLLQEVKEILAATHSQTTMRGDGQVISIPFNTMPVELSPGFRCQDGSIIICDANDGGRYKSTSRSRQYPRARADAQAVAARTQRADEILCDRTDGAALPRPVELQPP